MSSSGGITMNPVLLDTSMISSVIRQVQPIHSYANEHRALYDGLFIPSIAYYELKRGLLVLRADHRSEVRRDAARRLNEFERFFAANKLIALDQSCVREAADIWAYLKTRNLQGPNECDILIASIARNMGFEILTENRKDFEIIPRLSIADWS